MVIHWLVRLEFTPNKPAVYHGLCGVIESSRNMFHLNEDKKKVTCEICLAKIGVKTT